MGMVLEVYCYLRAKIRWFFAFIMLIVNFGHFLRFGCIMDLKVEKKYLFIYVGINL